MRQRGLWVDLDLVFPTETGKRRDPSVVSNISKLLILVKLDRNKDGLTGTGAAAPVFAKLADEALTYLNVQPDADRLVSR